MQVTSREIYIPLQMEFLALQGMGKLMQTVEIVKKRLNLLDGLIRYYLEIVVKIFLDGRFLPDYYYLECCIEARF